MEAGHSLVAILVSIVNQVRIIAGGANRILVVHAVAVMPSHIHMLHASPTGM